MFIKANNTIYNVSNFDEINCNYSSSPIFGIKYTIELQKHVAGHIVSKVIFSSSSKEKRDGMYARLTTMISRESTLFYSEEPK